MQEENSPPTPSAASDAPVSDVRASDAAASAPNAPSPAAAETPKAEFSDFMKIDLRVAQIMQAERIEKSAKLVKLQIDLGPELGARQIVAGVGKHYTPDTLVGRKIVVVANLAPAKLMGETSNGMLLAATNSDGFLELVSVSPETPLGSKVS